MFYRVLENTLSCIKDRFLECEEYEDEDFVETGDEDNPKTGYFLRKPEYNFNREIESDCYQELDEGIEDKRGCNYLASSYAMICNILGEQYVKFRQNYANITPGIYKQHWVQKCRTIHCKNAFVSFDVLAHSLNYDEVIFFDSKMLEWFVFKVNPIKDTFLREVNYYYEKGKDEFIELFQVLIPFYEKGKWEHKSLFRYYDGFSSVRQLLGVYNLCKAIEVSGQPEEVQQQVNALKNTKVVCCYWMAEHPEKFGSYRRKICNAEKRMHKEFLLFRQCIKPIQRLFRREFRMELEIEMVHYHDLINGIKKNDDHEQYLQRYVV